MTLDLDDLENKTRYAMTVPTCVVTKAELAALVAIAQAAVLQCADGKIHIYALDKAMRDAGLI